MNKTIEIEMIAIPEGKFMMGSYDGDDDEKPVHEVSIKAFHISKYPITQAQYQAIIGENPSRFKGKNNPVECVSWNDAQEFCQKLSQQTGKKYQLPTEAQWEYACRAGSKGEWCFGDDEFKLQEYAWCKDNSNDQTHPVGQKKPNQWGLYDMHGNVWEWCKDDWHDHYNDAPNDGSGWLDQQEKTAKLLRGGSFISRPTSCRSASRDSYYARDLIYHDYGFRVVC